MGNWIYAALMLIGRKPKGIGMLSNLHCGSG